MHNSTCGTPTSFATLARGRVLGPGPVVPGLQPASEVSVTAEVGSVFEPVVAGPGPGPELEPGLELGLGLGLEPEPEPEPEPGPELAEPAERAS